MDSGERKINLTIYLIGNWNYTDLDFCIIVLFICIGYYICIHICNCTPLTL